MNYFILFLLIATTLSCGKSEEDILSDQRKDYINSNIKFENNLGQSDSIFYKLFFDKDLIEHVYTKYNIPIKFCPDSKDSIFAFSYTKNPVPVTDTFTDFTIKSNRKIKYIARTIFQLSSYKGGDATILGDGVLFNETKMRLYTQLNLGYTDCLICLFIITEDNCTHTGFSRAYVKR
jgi:hypothetical protein